MRDQRSAEERLRAAGFRRRQVGGHKGSWYPRAIPVMRLGETEAMVLSDLIAHLAGEARAQSQREGREAQADL